PRYYDIHQQKCSHASRKYAKRKRLHTCCPVLKGTNPVAFTPTSILVTGGAGFIGSNFIHSFITNNPGCRVTNLDLLTYAGNLKNLTDVADHSQYRFVKGDVGDAALVAE